MYACSLTPFCCCSGAGVRLRFEHSDTAMRNLSCSGKKYTFELSEEAVHANGTDTDPALRQLDRIDMAAA